MKTCPVKERCYLLSLVDITLKRQIERFYCNRNYEKCARINLIKEGIPVPNDLFPNNKTCTTCVTKY